MSKFHIRLQNVLIIALIFQINFTNATFPASIAAKIRRTQSIRGHPLTSEYIPKTRPVSPSASSTSSATSHKSELDPKPSTSASTFHTESEPKPSTSTSGFHTESETKPILKEEQASHVHFSSSASLIDPMAVTHGDHLDPTRDGAFARAALRYGAATIIGTAIGIGGGYATKELLSQNSTQNVFINSTQNLSNQTQTDTDSIISNPFN